MKQLQVSSMEITDRDFIALQPLFEYLQSCVIEGRWLKPKPTISFDRNIKKKLVEFLELKHLLDNEVSQVSLNESENFEFTGVTPLEILTLLRKHVK